MKILLYGFGPYGDFPDNITQKILAECPDLPGVTKKVFDVRFDQKMFEDVFESVRLSIILGLGQHPTADSIRIEKIARNIRAERGGEPAPIDSDGPDSIEMSLALPVSEFAVQTKDAGDYVCNYSMWIAETFARTRGGKAAFIHIPRNMEVGDGLKYLVPLLDNLLHNRERVISQSLPNET